MSGSRSAQNLNRSFIVAIEEYVKDSSDVTEKPLEVELIDPFSSNIKAYVYKLSRYERDDNTFRIQPTSGPGPDDIEEDDTAILAGYTDELEEYEGQSLFAIFDPTVYTEEQLEASSPNRVVRERAIREAVETGSSIFVKERESTNNAEFVYTARGDALAQVLIKKNFRHEVRKLINKKLPDSWDETFQTHLSVEETVINFLTVTDIASPKKPRYQTAVSETAANNYGSDYETTLDSEEVISDWDEIGIENPWLAIAQIEEALSKSYPQLLNKARSQRNPNSILFNQADDLPETDDLYFPQKNIYDTIDSVLRSGKHLILTGPPGAGKSHLAEVVASHYAGSYEVTTATDDWTTFDTIGGYRKNVDGKLTFFPGLFLQRFLDPEGPDPKNEWLIVDELNRADIDKSFGSLFSALTKQNVKLPFDTQQGQVTVVGDINENQDLPLTDHHYYIPDDWRLIATMNTNDKLSLHRLSFAFMRRFAFVQVPTPKTEDEIRNNMSDYLSAWDIDPQDDTLLSDAQRDALPDDFEIEDIEENLADIWVAVQKSHDIGPAMIQDILEHLMTQIRQQREPDYGPAITAHVLPQLEGASEDEIENIISDFKDIEPLTLESINQFVREYLGVQITDE